MLSIRNILNNLLFRFIKFLLNIWFRRTKKDPGGTIRETIEELIEQDEENSEKNIDTDERALLTNVLDLKETPVTDVMIPRAQMIAINVKESRENVIGAMSKHQVQRIVVYQNTLDEVLGYVNLVECVMHKDNFNIMEILHPLAVVPPNMNILDLLIKMRDSAEKMVLVIDEYGGVEGIVPFIYLVQEIIGGVKSDGYYLNPPGRIIKRENGDIIADGYVELEQLEEDYGLRFIIDEDEDVSTIGGYICSFLGRLPARGEVITNTDGYEYVILDADPRKIKRVCIKKAEQ